MKLMLKFIIGLLKEKVGLYKNLWLSKVQFFYSTEVKKMLYKRFYMTL